MRLDTRQLSAIRAAAQSVFGPAATVRVFGSRVDDSARGGDIDLLISSPQPVVRPALLAADLAARLQLAMGDRRIDVVVEAPNLLRQPVHQFAHVNGVLL